MSGKWNGKRVFHIFVLALAGIALADLLFLHRDGGEKKGEESPLSWKAVLGEKLGQEVLDVWLPAFSFAGEDKGGRGFWQEILGQQSPLLAYGLEHGNDADGLQTESGSLREKFLLQEGLSEDEESEMGDALEMPQGEEGKLLLDEETRRRLQEENQAGSESGTKEEKAEQEDGEQDGPEKEGDAGNGTDGMVRAQEDAFGFVKAQTRSQQYDWSYYQDFDALIKGFYAVDATTEASPDQMQLDQLLGTDLTIEKNPDVPQILIYHTHSQETFADSVPGDASTSIVGAGELLAQILREEYGYNVIHDTGEYDVESRDNAYSVSLPAIEQILAQNPTIEVVIDLHRDAVLEGKLVTELNGKPTATFMFFNGLSYTKAAGNIEYLENPYIEENLAFSFQMQVIANEYYPGLTRRIYLKGYRYNMHLKPRSLLIELGAQTNTVEEIRNACAPIAHILDMELSGSGASWKEQTEETGSESDG